MPIPLTKRHVELKKFYRCNLCATKRFFVEKILKKIFTYGGEKRI